MSSSELVSTNWQPIATAPRDGNAIILWGKGKSPQVGRWYEEASDLEGFYSDNVGLGTFGKEQPTHWQPLPAPPEPSHDA